MMIVAGTESSDPSSATKLKIASPSKPITGVKVTSGPAPLTTPLERVR
jgi:hypothetical protein